MTAPAGRQYPTAEQVLAIQEYLVEEKKLEDGKRRQ
jgi:hypothetical protein